jgi:hypothetical protein
LTSTSFSDAAGSSNPAAIDSRGARGHIDRVRQVDTDEANRRSSELIILVRIRALVDAASSDPSLPTLTELG